MSLFLDFPFGELPGPGNNLIPRTDIPTPKLAILVHTPIQAAIGIRSLNGVLEWRHFDIPHRLVLVDGADSAVHHEEIVNGGGSLFDYELLGLDYKGGVHGLLRQAGL
jgi:hypothetical protein